MKNERYLRQIELIGEMGQTKLKRSCVMIIGAGGLGNIAAKFLAGSGVGKLIIVDKDKVEKSNLNRQVLFNINTIGKSKATALKDTLKKINPEVTVKAMRKTVNFNTEISFMKSMISENVDVILDCTDNMPSAYIVESMGLNLGIPVVYGKTSKYSGVVTIIKNPFLKAQYPNRQLNTTGAVFPTIGGIIGSMQASMALKILLGLKTSNDVFYYDSLNDTMVSYKKNRL